MNYHGISQITFTPKKGFPDVTALSQSVVFILNAKQNLHPKFTQQVLDGALWWMADYTGNGLKCSFRSKMADDICRGITNGNIGNQGLIYKHIIPKNPIRDKLLALPIPVDHVEVERLLKLSVYCLVHESDDKDLNTDGGRQNMPNGNWQSNGATSDEVWGRYKAKGMEVVKV